MADDYITSVTTPPEYVITEDVSSGRVHKRIPSGRGYMTHEADNLDNAGPFRIITEEQFRELPPDKVCKRCWPEDAAETKEAETPVEA